ncbi:hypothetical protein [Enterococcus spodopteracolus]|uniref:hypothetical protein n=1 Tax=Enterococcus spodopteracolus TaxID=3034501 RepID=UPI0026491D82|nr:hypothetical protein [Enterococcus spodopteracolus]
MENFRIVKKVDSLNRDKAVKEEIRQLLRLESEDCIEGQEVGKKIDFLNPKEECRVLGSKGLIDLYNSVDAEKIDLTIPLSDIEHGGWYHDDEIILNFVKEGWNARGIYSFTGDFLDSLFRLKTYGNFCLNSGCKDLLNLNLKEQFENQKDSTRQYRFLMDNETDEDTFLLRGITTTQYRNYDNYIALYLILNALHVYSKNNNVDIYVESGHISDSDLDIEFKQDKKISIDKDTSIEIGIRLRNNEIGEGRLKVEFIYTISDSNNGFNAMGDNVVSITHRSQTSRIKSELSNFSKLTKYTKETVDHVRNIKNVKKLDRDQLSYIFSMLSRAKRTDLRKNTKEKINEVYKNEIIGNTFSLISIFNKIESIETSIDEKEFIRIVFNDLIRGELSSI